MDRCAKVAIVLLVLTVFSIACGGARKPCDAPIRSLDVAPSASAEPADVDEAPSVGVEKPRGSPATANASTGPRSE